MTLSECILAATIALSGVCLLGHLIGQAWDHDEIRPSDEPVTPLHWRRR